jgi:alpha/beta superfamily hydrolase
MNVHEEAIQISASDGVILEARLGRGREPRGRGGALLCHPHPLYGGAMSNNVVVAARDALAGLGLTTLRFNFRGVGRSGGEHDGGRGEQLDLEAAFARLATEVEGAGAHLVAYSFGAWVAARALRAGLAPASTVLISPPVDFMDFSDLPPPTGRALVLSGDRDQFGAAAAVDRWLGPPGSIERVVLRGVDHFYGTANAEAALKEAIARFVGAGLEADHQ